MAAAAAAAAMASSPNVGFNSLIHHQMFQKPNSMASPFFLPAGECLLLSSKLVLVLCSRIGKIEKPIHDNSSWFRYLEVAQTEITLAHTQLAGAICQLPSQPR